MKVIENYLTFILNINLKIVDILVGGDTIYIYIRYIYIYNIYKYTLLYYSC